MKKILTFSTPPLVLFLMELAVGIGQYIQKNYLFSSFFFFLAGTSFILCFANPLIDSYQKMVDSQQKILTDIFDHIGVTKKK